MVGTLYRFRKYLSPPGVLYPPVQIKKKWSSAARLYLMLPNHHFPHLTVFTFVFVWEGVPIFLHTMPVQQAKPFKPIAAVSLFT